jgi:hypothetical protein
MANHRAQCSAHARAQATNHTGTPAPSSRTRLIRDWSDSLGFRFFDGRVDCENRALQTGWRARNRHARYDRERSRRWWGEEEREGGPIFSCVREAGAHVPRAKICHAHAKC